MAQRDPLGVGLGALLTGVGLGGAVVTLTEIVVNILRRQLDAADYQRAFPDPLFAGLLAALVVVFGLLWASALGKLRGLSLLQPKLDQANASLASALDENQKDQNHDQHGDRNRS